MTQHRGHTTAESLLVRLTATPDAFAQKLEFVRESFLVIELTEAAYRAASFLDDRILSPSTRGGWLPFDRVLQAAQSAVDLKPLHFIFHTGHVGSTLVSRLLDETGAVLSLREPLPLRALADAYDGLRYPESLVSPARFDELLAGQLRLWSRGYAATRCVVVKATSSTARFAPAILARSDIRAIYLNQGAESALATLLAGQNSLLDLRGHGPGRMRRLSSRLGCTLAPLYELSPGELAAMSWLAESLCRRDVLAGFPNQVIAVDFDAFLADVAGGMRRVLAQFELPIDERELSALATSPVLTRYSKAPEHAYGPAQRAALLQEARRGHREEIEKGLAWLAALAQEHEVVAAVLAPEVA